MGYANHRYFFLYMVYTTIGCLFLVIFGFDIGINVLFYSDGDGWFETEPLQGHPIRYNLTGHLVPVVTFRFFPLEMA